MKINPLARDKGHHHSNRLSRHAFMAAALLAVAITPRAEAQISITGTSPVTENFDTIGTSATASLPANWKMTSAGTGSSSGWATGTNVTATTQAASTGSPNTGARYNWGNGTTTTDRAVGFMTSGGYASPNAVMAYYTNNTGLTITDLAIAFDVERYRINTSAADVTFFTSADGSTWTPQTAGDTGAFATGTSTYNFTSGTVVSKTFSLTGLSIADGSAVYLKWVFNTTGSSSQGLGLDNVSLTATTSGALPNLAIAISPATFSESSGVQTNAGTVTIPAALGSDLVVTLTSADTTEATVPATVTVLAGQTTAQFDVTAVDDLLQDGNQSFNITASTAGYNSAQQSITVNDDGDTPLVVSVTPITFVENAGLVSLAGTVTLPASRLTDVTITLSSSDTTEVSFPFPSNSLLIPAGDTSAQFDLNVLNDSNVDGPQSVTITASSSEYTSGTFAITIDDDGDIPPPVIISQYYEGASNDKYIELYNTSADPVDLTDYRLTVWTNASAQNWKTATGSPNNNTSLSGITIPGNSFWLLKNTGAAAPSYASTNANSTLSGALGGYNGNDSVVLYVGATNAIANIVDAVSFTELGNEGQDKTFYRLSNTTGYDLTAGTTVLTYPAVWASKTLAEVASAASTDAWYLNYYTAPQAPTLDSFTAGHGATTTASRIVTLNYSSTGGTPLEYRVSELPDLSDGTWASLSNYLTYTLSSGVGSKTVYFQLRNATGESSIISWPIELVAYSYAPPVLITQYYEPDGSGGNSKYIELTNVSGSPVSMTGWKMVRWTNQDTDHWLHTGAITSNPSSSIDISSLGTLAAGQTVILSHTSASSPIAAASAQLTSGEFSFNGNDSMALYAGSVDPTNLIDVVGFTNLGNEGADKSFVRQNNNQGFTFTAGSKVTDFPTVWSEVTLATVAAAGSTDNNKLGVYPGGGSAYSSWASTNSTTQTSDLDHDGDGVSNGVEYFLGGNTNTTGFTATPGVVNTAGTLSVTWVKAADYTGIYGTDFVVETSNTLSGAWTTETLGVNVVITGNDVKYTFPAGTKNFARLKVTGP